jgi:hypothetical protein
MISKIIFHAKNTDIVANLNEAANRITEQEEIINHLREKLEGEKEVLKGELEVDYKQMEEVKDRYIQYYSLAPFHLTEIELSDLNEFRDYHESSREEPDEEGYRFCRRATGFRMPIIYHYVPSMYSHKVTVECPYCHTQRELGSGTDVLEERENCVNES